MATLAEQKKAILPYLQVTLAFRKQTLRTAVLHVSLMQWPAMSKRDEFLTASRLRLRSKGTKRKDFTKVATVYIGKLIRFSAAGSWHLQRAEEIDSLNPKVAYYCRVYAIEQVGEPGAHLLFRYLLGDMARLP